ncbi:MAG: penicillin acylase family protein [Caldilineales bacterium]
MPPVLFPLLSVIVFLAAVLALGFIAVLWYIFWRPLARTKQDLVIDDLSAPVEIVRDRWGVAHIYAQTARDAYLAQGYVHAQDRLFQLEYSRLLARGTLAEALGPAALEADRWSRVIGVWRAAERDAAAVAPDDRAALAAYTAGINAFLEANQLRKPAEFTIVGHTPRPWRVQDTVGILKVLGWALSMNWEGELVRMQLIERLGPERAAELDPALSYGDAAPGEHLDPAALETAGQLMAAYRSVAGWFGQSPAAGSNNWVVGPQRVAGRQPMLANDPHLTVSIPSLWYENHLEAADGSLRVTGATFAGIPGVVSGHNADIAWGITAGRADNQDLYVEQSHPDDPTSFRTGDGWQPAIVLRESFAVRGQAEPVVEDVIITRHGPLINSLIPAEARASLPPLALRWSGHEAGAAIAGLLALQSACDWTGFRAALACVGEPSMNFVYGDRAGNIGYQYAARVPQRRSGHGLVPANGWDDSHEWEGFLPFDSLPSQLNPPDGFAASANNRPPQRADSPWIGADWDPGYRYERIVKLLQSKPRFTLRDFQRFQTDVYSGLAELLTPTFVLAEASSQLERRVLRELEGWNLRMEVDSFPAAAFEVMRLHLLDILLSEKLGPVAASFKGRTISDIFAASPFSGHTGPFLVRLLENETSWWYGDDDAGQPRTREAVLTLALQRTAVTLYEMIGKDPRKWAWGKVHQIEFSHPFGRGRVLHWLFNRGQYPVGGNDHTVWMTANELALPFGLVTTTATYRQVVQVGDWDRATAILSTGQSGQPGSPHYADHIDLWREGEQHPMLWSRAAVDNEAEATLWLRPPA